MKKIDWSNKFIHLIFIILSFTFIIPFMFVVSISLSNEQHLIEFGYRLIPKSIDLSGYMLAFSNPKQVIDSYKVTIFFSVFGTFLSMLLTTMMAYALSRNAFEYRKHVFIYLFITMFFSGGLIPTYILNTQYLKLRDSIWIYILPSMVGTYQILVLRSFFKGLPDSLIESAKIDGAGELTICFRIIVPLSLPAIATLSLMGLLGRWNNWYTSLIYITKPSLYSLQYLLQRILREAEFLDSISREHQLGIASDLNEQQRPLETLRYALVVITTGPMLFVFAFLQKYFTSGLTIGAIKG